MISRPLRRLGSALMLLALLGGQAAALSCDEELAATHEGHVEPERTGHMGMEMPVAGRVPAEGSSDAGGHHGAADEGEACQVLMSCGALAVLDRAQLLPPEARVLIAAVVTLGDSAPSIPGELELPPPRQV